MQAASLPADGLAGLLVDAALDDVRHVLVVAQLGGVLDQAVVLLGLVVGLDDGLVLLGLDLLLDLIGLDLGAELGLGRGDALDRGNGGTGPGTSAPRSVEDLEVEHGTAGGAGDRGSAEVVEAGATALADPLRAPFRLGQTQSPGGRCKSEGGNCHGGPELSKANSVATTADGQASSRFTAMLLRAAPHGALSGAATLPGDKSISHRSLMLAAMPVGESGVHGLLEGEDVLATAKALRAMGVELERVGDGSWRVWGVGVGGLAEPADVLDLGNAGTGVRLLMGLLAGHGFTSFLTGDASLRSRPMLRVIEPLSRMGVAFLSRTGGRLPLALTGGTDLLPIVYESPVASAQVKSAVLLAGLHAPGATTVIEHLASRDHSERMLAAMGAEVTVEVAADGGRRVTIAGQPELHPQSFVVRGDPPSAGFPAVAAAVTPGSQVRLRGVGLNPLRTGLYTTLREMGADLMVEDERVAGGEPVGDLVIRGRELMGVEVPADRAPSMIDEYPILAVAAAFARGATAMRGLSELRVKESDRLGTMAAGLAACGVKVTVEGDDLIVQGGGRPAGGVAIDAKLDHRIAMSFLVLGGLAAAPVTVAGAEAIETSFPGFASLMNGLGAAIAPAEEAA